MGDKEVSELSDGRGMKLVMPSLELLPGKMICLHIPHGFDAAGEDLERVLLQLTRAQAKTFAICRLAEPRSDGGKPSLKQRSSEWLSLAANLSIREAEEFIASLSVEVDDKLAYNACTPRTLLGIAAAMHSKPEVLAYSTVGLDLEGCRTVHRYIASECNQACVFHLSYPAVFGDGSPHPRSCPTGGECITLVGG